MTEAALSVLVVGCGNMGVSHARAYHRLAGFRVVGVVNRGDERRQALAAELDGVPAYAGFEEALAATRPDAVSINTYPDTHAEYATAALEAGAHVFVEKPLARTVEDAQAVVDLAVAKDRKLVVGYILRHHPSWTRFVEVARSLGKPLVMRMNLNQQSSGGAWEAHKKLLDSLSPIADCGVHYVDIMCQMTRARPVRVHAIGARLHDDVPGDMYNYGQLQVSFDDGSIGWYEAGWGPMMSETAYFVKDVVGPAGSVSIVGAGDGAGSADIEAHTSTQSLRVHRGELDEHGEFAAADDRIDMSDEPGHQELCDREQEFFLRAIREDLDLGDHMDDAVASLRIVLAADESIRSGRVIEL